jgi:hypothetical protein
MSQKSSVPQAVSFVSQVLKRDSLIFDFANRFLTLNHTRKLNYLFTRLWRRQLPELWLARSGHHVQ